MLIWLLKYTLANFSINVAQYIELKSYALDK